jgi:hypothetical protein
MKTKYVLLLSATLNGVRLLGLPSGYKYYTVLLYMYLHCLVLLVRYLFLYYILTPAYVSKFMSVLELRAKIIRAFHISSVPACSLPYLTSLHLVAMLSGLHCAL